LIHEIFQRTGLSPGAFWRKPMKEQAFMLASMEYQLEMEAQARREAEEARKRRGKRR